MFSNPGDGKGIGKAPQGRLGTELQVQHSNRYAGCAMQFMAVETDLKFVVRYRARILAWLSHGELTQLQILKQKQGHQQTFNILLTDFYCGHSVNAVWWD